VKGAPVARGSTAPQRLARCDGAQTRRRRPRQVWQGATSRRLGRVAGAADGGHHADAPPARHAAAGGRADGPGRAVDARHAAAGKAADVGGATRAPGARSNDAGAAVAHLVARAGGPGEVPTAPTEGADRRPWRACWRGERRRAAGGRPTGTAWRPVGGAGGGGGGGEHPASPPLVGGLPPARRGGEDGGGDPPASAAGWRLTGLHRTTRRLGRCSGLRRTFSSAHRRAGADAATPTHGAVRPPTTAPARAAAAARPVGRRRAVGAW